MVDVFSEETGTRNRAYAGMFCQKFAEFKIAAVTEFRNIRKNIISSLRNSVRNSSHGRKKYKNGMLENNIDKSPFRVCF